MRRMGMISPHSIVLIAAAGLGFAGKLAFPQSSVRVALAAAAALPLWMALYLRDLSLLGFVLVVPLSLAGSVAGVIGAKIAAKGIAAVKR
jgi:hypothetical protein